MHIIEEHLYESAAVKQKTAEHCRKQIVAASDLITHTFRSGRKLLLCGNGGSAADCQHLAAEFVCRLTKEFKRPALPAIALTTDTSFLTAFTNDCGYENVFARQIEALGQTGDVLLAISTSGRSTNIIRAVEIAHRQSMQTIALTGMGHLGQVAALANLVDVAIAVPSHNTQYIQETHLAIEHILCHVVERNLYADRPEEIVDRTVIPTNGHMVHYDY